MLSPSRCVGLILGGPLPVTGRGLVLMDQVLAKGTCDPLPSSDLLKNSSTVSYSKVGNVGSSLRSSKGWEKPGVDMNCWRCEGIWTGKKGPGPVFSEGGCTFQRIRPR